MSLNVRKIDDRAFTTDEGSRVLSRVFVWLGGQNVTDSLSRGETQAALEANGYDSARVVGFGDGTTGCNDSHFVLSEAVKSKNKESVDLHIHIN